MDRLSPFDSLLSTTDPDSKVIAIDEEEVDAILGSIGSETARQILAALYEEPRTMSELADELDSSVQNVDYHLQKFEDAGVVEAVDTLNPDHGRATTLWAPIYDPIVVMAGSERQTSGIYDMLPRLAGAVGVLALASLVVEGLTRLFRGTGPGNRDPDIPPPATPTHPVAESTPAGTAGVGGLFTDVISPGLVFFVGGLFVLALVVIWLSSRQTPQ